MFTVVSSKFHTHIYIIAHLPSIYTLFRSSTPQLYSNISNFEQSVVIQLDFDVAAEMNWDGGDFEDLINCSTNEPGGGLELIRIVWLN